MLLVCVNYKEGCHNGQQFPHTHRLCVWLLLWLWINRVVFLFFGALEANLWIKWRVWKGLCMGMKMAIWHGACDKGHSSRNRIIGNDVVSSIAFLKWKWCVECWLSCPLPRPKGPQLKYEPANHVFQIFVGPISCPLGRHIYPYVIRRLNSFKRRTQKKHRNCCSTLMKILFE